MQPRFFMYKSLNKIAMYVLRFFGIGYFSLKLFYIPLQAYPARPSTIIIIQQDVQAISYYILKTSRSIVQHGSYA